MLSFDERAAAEHSGNFWQERPPSVARSADGRLVAYAAEDGLFTFDLERGSRRTLVERTAPGVDEDSPGSWSGGLGSAFAIHSPAWSHDGRFLSFDVSHYEGHSIWFFELSAGRLFRQDGLPRYSYSDPSLGSPSWAPAGASSVVPHNGTRVGFVMSAADDPTTATLYRVRAGSVAEAVVSADAALAAYTFGSDEFGERPTGLAMVRRGETDRRVIDDSGVKTSVAFDSIGRLWWVEGGRLFSWDGSRAHDVGRLDDRLRWRILSVVGDIVSLAGRSADEGVARFVALDTASGQALLRHDSDTDFTTYLVRA